MRTNNAHLVKIDPNYSAIRLENPKKILEKSFLILRNRILSDRVSDSSDIRILSVYTSISSIQPKLLTKVFFSFIAFRLLSYRSLMEAQAEVVVSSNLMHRS